MHLFFGILGGILGVSASCTYWWAIIRRKTQPQLYTWVIWSIISSIACVVQFRNNAGWGNIVSCFLAANSILVSILSLKYGKKDLSTRDKYLLVGAGCAFILWQMTGNDLLAIILVCLIDSIAYFFTWKKVYYLPYSENILSYILWSAEFLCAYLAISDKNLINSLHPLVIGTIEALFILFMLWRRKVVK